MTDLTKLTAEELMRFSPDIEGVMPEIRRRLERLEKCEAELKKQAQGHLHYIAACDQTEDELLERLEQCEAAIAKCKHAGECGYDAARAVLEGK